MKWPAALMLAGSAVGVAHADAPPEPLRAVQTACAPRGGACATIRRLDGITLVRSAAGAVLWRARSMPPAAFPSRDGRFLVEEYRPGGIVALEDGPDTLLLVIRDSRRVTRRLYLRDVTSDPRRLPKSVSHRQWSLTRAFDEAGRLVIDTGDGRRLRIDPATGRGAWQRLHADGRTAVCRPAGPDTGGPCARR